jgi:hypothetical protein
VLQGRVLQTLDDGVKPGRVVVEYVVERNPQARGDLEHEFG